MNTDTAKQRANDLAKDILCSIIEKSDRDKSFLTSSSFDESVRDITGLIIKAEELTQANQKIQELEKDKQRLDRLEKLPAVSIWQGTFADNDYNISLGRAGAPIVTLSTMDADGSEIDEEIGRGDTLRAAIDSVTST